MFAAKAMRGILIDRARDKGALKRGGHPRRLRLDQDPLASDDISADLLDLDDALKKLAAEDPAKAELVKLRFFARKTLKEAAGRHPSRSCSVRTSVAASDSPEHHSDYPPNDRGVPRSR